MVFWLKRSTQEYITQAMLFRERSCEWELKKMIKCSSSNRTEWNMDIGILQTGAQNIPIYQQLQKMIMNTS
jgi:long-chain acyl-CoA synthetase